MSGLEQGFEAIQNAISAQLVATTRTANQLAAEDIGFLGSTDPKAKRKLERQNRHLLELAQRLISNASTDSAAVAAEIKKPSKIDENWRSVVDVVDSLLERADRSLDEFHGIIRQLGSDKEEGNAGGASKSRESRSRRIHPLTKPQLAFKHVPKNDETTAFRPLLTSKPHAVVPLEESLLPVAGESGRDEYKHPYEAEITQSDYPDFVRVKAEPIPPNEDPDGKTLQWVETLEQVQVMLKELKQAKEIAIDLEHHDQHSFVGLVSLMQISTRDKDWIVDTLKPWRRDLQVLNEVFTDPAILKVFHGSTMDMIWLQRDLGLYVVGLFDTYHATVALQYPRHGLAHLLKHFENFDAQKQYQMADWRTRPLTADMMHYARADTHYLLHIYDNLRNELIDGTTNTQNGNLIDYVLRHSKEEALQRYERVFYDAEGGLGTTGWLSMIMKTPAHFSKEQFAVFRAVHRFRDDIARQTDESHLSVMRNDTVFAIARTMPEDMPSLMSCINPVTQFIQPKLTGLLNVIKKARKEGEDGPELSEILDRPETQKLRKKLTRWTHRAEPLPQSATTGVAEVLRRTKEAAPIAEASTFWGPMLGSGASNGYSPNQDAVTEMQGLSLSLPIPSASSAENIPLAEAQPVTQAIEPTVLPANPPESTEPEIFTISERRKSGKKRKAEEALNESLEKQEPQEEAMEIDGIVEQRETLNSLNPLKYDRSVLGRASKKNKPSGPVSRPDEETMKKGAVLAELTKAQRRAEIAKDASLAQLWASYKTYDKYQAKSRQQRKTLIQTATKLASKDGEGAETAKEVLRRHEAGEDIPEELQAQVEASQFWGEEEKAADQPEAFDYTQAESVLNAAQGVSDRYSKKDKKDKKKKEKHFDPYSKVLDTPKGLPKPKQGTSTGRSKTFKK